MAPSAFAAVRDITGRILLVRRCDTGDWELPGGHVHPGESANHRHLACKAEYGKDYAQLTGPVHVPDL